MKQKKGITLIEMVLTIVVLLILSGLVIFSSRRTIDETDVTKVYTEMSSVKKAVENAAILMEINPNNSTKYRIAENELDVTDLSQYNEDELPTLLKDQISGYTTKFYKLSKADKDLIRNLELEGNLKGKYLINYDTKDIILLSGISRSGQRAYTMQEATALIEDIYQTAD